MHLLYNLIDLHHPILLTTVEIFHYYFKSEDQSYSLNIFIYIRIIQIIILYKGEFKV